MDYESKTIRQFTITLTDKEALELIKEINALQLFTASDPNDTLYELYTQLSDFARGFFDDAPALQPVWEEVVYNGEVTYKENP